MSGDPLTDALLPHDEPCLTCRPGGCVDARLDASPEVSSPHPLTRGSAMLHPERMTPTRKEQTMSTPAETMEILDVLGASAALERWDRYERTLAVATAAGVTVEQIEDAHQYGTTTMQPFRAYAMLITSTVGTEHALRGAL